MDWMNKVTGILQQYTGAGPSAAPDEVMSGRPELSSPSMSLA
jgi:hypothetical protein